MSAAQTNRRRALRTDEVTPLSQSEIDRRFLISQAEADRRRLGDQVLDERPGMFESWADLARTFGWALLIAAVTLLALAAVGVVLTDAVA